MGYLRRPRKIFNRRGVSGDPKVTQETIQSATPDQDLNAEIELAEAIYDEAVRVELLYNADKTLTAFEDLIEEQLKDIAVLLDPDKNFELVKAVTTLAGEPKLVLDGDIIQMAADLAMDGYVHMNGFDPVAAILGLYGGDEAPNVPVPNLLADFQEMSNEETLDYLGIGGSN